MLRRRRRRRLCVVAFGGSALVVYARRVFAAFVFAAVLARAECVDICLWWVVVCCGVRRVLCVLLSRCVDVLQPVSIAAYSILCGVQRTPASSAFVCQPKTSIRVRIVTVQIDMNLARFLCFDISLDTAIKSYISFGEFFAEYRILLL